MAARRIDRLASLAALAVIVASGVALVGALRAEPWVRFALRLETAATPPDITQPIRDRLGEALASEDGPRCDWDLPKARVTVALELLRRSLDDVPGSIVRAEAERTAREAVREAIGCNVSDGNLWYLEALLDQRAGADWESVRERLLLSAALTPREADALQKRAQLVGWQIESANVDLPLDLKEDLRRAAAIARVETVAPVLARLRSSGHEALAEEMVAGLSEERKAALAAGTSWQRSTLGRPERYRTYEYRPFGDTDR